MNYFRIIATVALAIALWGCGGMSASECELADWRAVGYEDGSRGRPTDTFGRHRKACAKHEVAADFDDYQDGRQAGLREYCKPERGYQEGARGAQYHGVCPAGLEPDFYDAFVEGQILYNLESAVAKTRRQLDSNKARMNSIEKQLAENTSDAIRGLPSDQLAELVVETKQLAEERITLAQENEQLEQQLAREQEELAAHKSQLVTRR
jgi:hypothetical protein